MTGYLKSLELDKIVEKAAGYAACPQAAALLREQEPLTNVEEVRFALGKTDAVNSLLLKNGSPRFSGVDGVKGIVARGGQGGRTEHGRAAHRGGHPAGILPPWQPGTG